MENDIVQKDMEHRKRRRSVKDVETKDIDYKMSQGGVYQREAFVEWAQGLIGERKAAEEGKWKTPDRGMS